MTGQFYFLSFVFSPFYPHLQQRVWFSINFPGRFQSFHPQNNILYPIAQNKSKASNWLCLLKLSETFHCAGLQDLNLGPALFGHVSLPQRNLLAFLHFKVLGSTQMLSKRELHPHPLNKNSGLSPETKRVFCRNPPHAGYKATHISV